MSYREPCWHRRASVLFLVLCCHGLFPQQAMAARIIKVQAEKFRYTPSVIKVRRGEEIELQISSKDRLHGFSLPDLNIRADILPGETIKIKFIAKRSGRFGFLCDIFCGTGHGAMRGQLLVVPDSKAT